jgi:O-antigen/teichoic acid export membrane protein
MSTGPSGRRHVRGLSVDAEGLRRPASSVGHQLYDVAKAVNATMIGRFGWGLADQLLASATNFLLGLFVAGAVGARDLGAFSVAYATFTLALGAIRAIAGELLVVRHSAVPADEWRAGVRGAAGMALLSGIAAGGVCLIVSARFDDAVGDVLRIVGISLPFLLVQDVWRFAFFARSRGGAAFINDVVWTIAMFTAFGVLWQLDVSSVAWFTAAWAGAGCIAAIVGVLQLGLLPAAPVHALRWLSSHRDLAPRFFAEFTIGSGVSHLTVFAIGAIAGLGELGRLRAGEIVLGPLNVLFAGVGMVATAEAVRLLSESRRRFVSGCLWLSLLLAAGVTAWGAIVLLLPANVGKAVLGSNWDAAQDLVPPLLLALIGYAFSFGAWTGLRSLAAARRSLRARTIDGLLTVLLGLSGAYLAGATGVAWGYAITGCVRSLNAWWQFSAALREHERGRVAAPTTAPTVAPSG